jgi:ketosteroid isomerase-like protein
LPGDIVSFSNLPQPIAAFLKAMKELDRKALIATFSEDAVLTDMGKEYRGGALREWNDRLFAGSDVRVHAINVAQRDGQTIVTVMVDGDYERIGSAEPFQLDWYFAIKVQKISALTIIRTKAPDVPEPVAAYIRATNTFNLDALLVTFAEDALVNDQLRDFWGKAAIKHWAEHEIIGDRVTMYVVKVVKHYDEIIVTAHVDGDYDKRGLPEPLVLAFYFSLREDKIIQLIILHNKPAC